MQHIRNDKVAVEAGGANTKSYLAKIDHCGPQISATVVTLGIRQRGFRMLRCVGYDPPSRARPSVNSLPMFTFRRTEWLLVRED